MLDTNKAGRPDAFNPAEMLLASLAACILKGAERIIPMLEFNLRGIDIAIRGTQQDSPPKMSEIAYEIVVDTNETDQQNELLDRNLQEYRNTYNSLAGATELSGSNRRQD